MIEGLGYSGSGAALDLLRELDGVFVMPTEFRLINDPDGLLSLESALVDNWTIFQSDSALRRFRRMCYALARRYRSPYAPLDHERVFHGRFMEAVDTYLEDLTGLRYRGIWYGIDSVARRFLNRFDLLKRAPFITEEMHVGRLLSREAFLERTRAFVAELEALADPASEVFVFDGDYSAMNPARVLDYVPDGRMLVVVRDPRDVMAQVRQGTFLFAPEGFDAGLEWQRLIWTRAAEAMRDLPEDRVQVLHFEDLVLRYDEALPRVFEFLGLDPARHTRPKTRLDPARSSHNVGIWRQSLTPEEAERVDQTLGRIQWDRNLMGE
jgi:hypothetical protein